jgi:hypothetical protein
VRRRARRAALVLTLAGIAPWLSGQSLGSAAEKEKDRHKKNQDNGVKARAVTDEELTKDRPVELPPGTPPPEPKPRGETARPSKAAGSPPARKAVAPPGGPTPAHAEGAPANPDAWRERMAQARQRLAWAERSRDAINSRLAQPAALPVDETASYEEHDRLTGSPEQLRALLHRVQIEIDVAQKTVEVLEAEARRGASPAAGRSPGLHR